MTLHIKQFHFSEIHRHILFLICQMSKFLRNNYIIERKLQTLFFSSIYENINLKKTVHFLGKVLKDASYLLHSSLLWWANIQAMNSFPKADLK